MVTVTGFEVVHELPTRLTEGARTGDTLVTLMLNTDVALVQKVLKLTVPVTGLTCAILKVAVASPTPSIVTVDVAGGSAMAPVSLPVTRSTRPLNVPRGTLTV